MRVWWLVHLRACNGSALTLLSCAALGPVQHSHVWPCVAHVLFVHAFTHRFAPVNATTSVFFDETNKQVCVACVCVCARAIHSSSSCAMCWPLRAVALCSPPLFISLAHTMCVCACACCVFQTLASSAHSHTCTHIHWCAHKHNQCSCNTSYVSQDVGTSTPFVNGMPIARAHSSRDPNDHLRLRCAGVCGSRRVARSAGQVARNL